MRDDTEDVEVNEDVEPEEAESLSYTKSSRKPFSKLTTELTNDDLGSSGVQKMLLAEISRLESNVHYLDRFKEKFYDADKDRAILKAKEKTFNFTEVLYSVSLTLGAAIMGLTPSISSNIFAQYAIGIIGIILVSGAILAKVKVKK